MDNEKKLYLYVYQLILNDIYNGKYLINQKLPSLTELSKTYSVGRNTIRSALLLLQERGYIKMNKGALAKVTFDIYNFSNDDAYRQEFIDMKQLIADIFDTMAIILPNISILALNQATKKEFETLNNMIDGFSGENITNDYSLLSELFNIYFYAFSFLNNPILNDMFNALLSSARLPITNDDKIASSLNKNIKAIKNILKTIIRFYKSGNYFMIKILITIMCKSMKKSNEHYIDTICSDLTPQNEVNFTWISNRNQEYLYTQIVLDILKDINDGIYQTDTILPSISKLAKKYQVSEKTSRKALEFLRQCYVIETINGVGSIVNTNRLDGRAITNNPELNDFITHFYNSLSLIKMINDSIIKASLKNSTKQELEDLALQIKSRNVFNVDIFWDFIFSKQNSCIYAIYLELNKSMGWSILISKKINFTDLNIDIHNLENTFLTALQKRDIATIIETNDLITCNYLKLAKNLLS